MNSDIEFLVYSNVIRNFTDENMEFDGKVITVKEFKKENQLLENINEKTKAIIYISNNFYDNALEKYLGEREQYLLINSLSSKVRQRNKKTYNIKICNNEAEEIDDYVKDYFIDNNNSIDAIICKIHKIIYSLNQYTNDSIGGSFSAYIIKSINDIIDIFPEFTKLVLSDSSKLYILVAPSGFGKSTLINSIKYFGVSVMPKVTTRPYRKADESKSKSIDSISYDKFRQLTNKGLILGVRKANEHCYGLYLNDFLEFSNSGRNYITDSTDLKSAYELRKKYPNRIRLVAIFPGVGFAGLGLEKRLDNLTIPSEGFDSFINELKFMSKKKSLIQDTQHRLNNIIQQAYEFKRYLPHLDIVLDSTQMKKNIEKLLTYMVKE